MATSSASFPSDDPPQLPSASSSVSCFAPVSFLTSNDSPIDDRKRTILSQAANSILINNHVHSLTHHHDVLNVSDPRIKDDIIRLMVQYLTDEGYLASTMTLQDETNVRVHETAERHTDLRRLRKSVLDGDWTEVDKLALSSSVRAAILLGKHHKPFLYALYKQQYLELIEYHEVHKAFTFLTKRLKPLEMYQATADEFRDLCYLLTAKSVHDAPAFRNWEGIGPGRERLAEQLQAMVDLECVSRDVFIPPNRLTTLLRQAVSYQVEFARYHPKVPPRIQTLLEDYTPLIIPNSKRHVMVGHKGNVKCVDFIGVDGKYLISGSSDNTARLWHTETGTPLATLLGHSSRIWNVASDPLGQLVVTASGDSTVRLWSMNQIINSCDVVNVSDERDTCGSTCILPGSSTSNTINNNHQPMIVTLPQLVLSGHDQGDVYTVSFHPTGQHLVTGGYDRCVRLWDVNSGLLVKTFAAGTPITKSTLTSTNIKGSSGVSGSNGISGLTSSLHHHHHHHASGPGHSLAVTAVALTPMGNLIVSGSKDSTVRFWDIVSGLCVRTLTSHLGEVTSVSMSPSGTYLLTSSKDNANRLWDMRMLPRPVRRYKGHTNTAKNFVRAAFAGPSDGTLIIGGSEDGIGHVWDRESGAVLETLHGHLGIVYDVKWNARQQLFTSCSDDSSVCTWTFDDTRPLGCSSHLPQVSSDDNSKF